MFSPPPHFPPPPPRSIILIPGSLNASYLIPRNSSRCGGLFICPRLPWWVKLKGSETWILRNDFSGAPDFALESKILNRAQRSKSIAFPCVSGVRRPGIRYTYIELHDGTKARESWSVLPYRNVHARLRCDVIVLLWSFMYSCVLHISQYVGFA